MTDLTPEQAAKLCAERERLRRAKSNAVVRSSNFTPRDQRREDRIKEIDRRLGGAGR